jgi:predicted nucleotidyltransferase
MLLDDLIAKKDEIRQLCQRHGARRVRVFGSVARREERADSDIDFLVDLPRGYDLFRQRIPLTESLSAMLNRRVELIPEHELNRHLRAHVQQEAIEL